MTNWTPSPLLVGDPDPWDYDECSRRRRLSGVAQGIEDLRAVAVHFKRDPDEAVAAWERYARETDDDGMATFNQFTREWQIGPLGAYLGTNNPLMSLLSRPGHSAGRYPTTIVAWDTAPGPNWRRPRRTAAQVHAQLDEFAARKGLDPAALWQEFNEFYVSVPLDLEGAVEQFLGQKRLSTLQVQITVQIADGLSATLARMQDALLGLDRSTAASTLTVAELNAVMANLSTQSDPNNQESRRCYRCAELHGSRPCRQSMRGRALTRR
jgi:hypothetical protein